MKALRQLCAASVLALALTLSAFAGDMSTGITAPPPPPPSESQVTTTGDMTTGVTGEITTGVTATDPAMEVMLSLLQSLLSLF